MAVTNVPAGYFDGLNQKLFGALPPARRVLELGCANGHLGRAYKATYPDAHWTGVDRSLPALARAADKIDHTILLDLDGDRLGELEQTFDLIVFGDLVEHLKDPEQLLRTLLRFVDDDGRLVCCIPNMNHISVIERLLIGDLSYDPNGLLDATHLRLFSPSSAIKTLLDGGWIPSLVDAYTVHADGPVFETLKSAARLVGSNEAAFERNATTYQMIFDCVPARRRVPKGHATAPSVAVVVAVTSHLQLALNLARSPGLREMDAALVPVFDATSAADAFERGRARTGAEWIVFAHQDVYLPVGSGRRLLEALAELADTRPHPVVGFIGLATAAGRSFNGIEDVRPAGTIVDRVHRIQDEPTLDAISVDECIIVLNRDHPDAIDASLGWHLWATELIWAAKRRSDAPACRLLDVPVFHNSVTQWTLPPEFAVSRDRLLAKYPERENLHSLCGTWSRQAG